MMHFVSVDADGFIVGSTTAMTMPHPDLGKYTQVPVPYLLKPGRVAAMVNGKLIDYGEPETPFHEFNRTTRQWVFSNSLAWEAVRKHRDKLLAVCDWRVVKAMESGQPLETAWAVYRQELRDITEQPDPLQIIWPEIPN